MRNLILLILFILAWSAVEAAPFRNGKTEWQLGAGVLEDMSLEYDSGQGASNAKLDYSSSNDNISSNKDLELSANKVLFGQGQIYYDSGESKLKFSVDGGSTSKAIGSGSGGGEGGVNISTNPSFEDGLADWTASGGTFSQQTFGNFKEGDEKYARWLPSAGSQTLSMSETGTPDNLGFGCMADFEYDNTSGNLFTYRAISGLTPTATVLAESILAEASPSGSWQKAPTLTFECPDAGEALSLQIEASGSGQLDLNKVYLGSNKGFISSDKLNSASALIENNGAASILSSSDDFLESVNFVSTGIVDLTFKSGYFTVPPVLTGSHNGVGPSSYLIEFYTITKDTARVRTVNTSGAVNNFNFSVFAEKQGVDTSQSQEAFSPDQVSNAYAEAYTEKGSTTGTVNLGAGTDQVASMLNTTQDIVPHPSYGGMLQACDAADSTGLGCAGNENIGFAYNFKTAGDWEICIEAPMACNFGGAGSCEANVEVMQTENTTNTIIKRGENRNSTIASSSASGDSHFVDNPTCAIFPLSVGKHTFKLFHNLTGGALSTKWSGGTGANRDDHRGKYSARLVSPNINTPILIGGGLHQGSQNKRMKVWTLVAGGVGTVDACTSSPCTIFKEAGPTNDWIDGNVTRSAGGNYALLTQPVFKPNEWVNCSIKGSSSSQIASCGLNALSNVGGNNNFQADGTGRLDFRNGGTYGIGCRTTGSTTAQDVALSVICFSEE